MNAKDSDQVLHCLLRSACPSTKDIGLYGTSSLTIKLKFKILMPRHISLCLMQVKSEVTKEINSFPANGDFCHLLI